MSHPKNKSFKSIAKSLSLVPALVPAFLLVVSFVVDFCQPYPSDRAMAAPAKTTLSKKAGSPLFENAAIAPQFKPEPLVLRGISGGKEEMQKESGRKESETGPCIGFIDSVPDHQITLMSDFSYLKIEVMSSGDTTLLIKGPGGSWCSDDAKNRNPEIGGKWLPGTYQVWVGSYEANASYPYLLQLTEAR